MTRSVRSIAALAALALFSAACSADASTDADAELANQALARGQQTIIEIARGNPELSTLVAAIAAADLEDRFGGRRQVTVFAPTNEAFAKLGLTAENIATELSAEQLSEILLHHVTPGVRVTKWLGDAKEVSSKQGAKLSVSSSPDGLFLNKSKIEQADIYATNGVVHLIDAVLMPPTN